MRFSKANFLEPMGFEAAIPDERAAMPDCPDEWSDAELLTRIGCGDEAAWDRMFERHGRTVYRFALRSTGSPDAADEVVQEVFLALIRNTSGFDPRRGALRSYLFGAARNQIARRARLGPVLEEPPEAVEAGTPLAEMEAAERLATVRQAVATLPETYREAVILCDLEELSYDEAAAALEVPVGTVRSRLSRGRALLERKLALAPALQQERR